MHYGRPENHPEVENMVTAAQAHDYGAQSGPRSSYPERRRDAFRARKSARSFVKGFKDGLEEVKHRDMVDDSLTVGELQEKLHGQFDERKIKLKIDGKLKPAKISFNPLCIEEY